MKMLRLSWTEINGAAPTSRVKYEDCILAASVQLPNRSHGVVIVNRWTFVLDEDRRILELEGWLPQMPNKRPPPSLIAAKRVCADVHLMPEYDNNCRASYHYGTDSVYFEPAIRAVVLCWSDSVRVHICQCASQLCVIANDQMNLVGALILNCPD